MAQAVAKKLPANISRVMADLWDDRVGFVKHIIGVTPTDQQGDALVAMDEGDHVSVRSGHGCGKSGDMAWLLLHYMSCRPTPKILCTAPSKHQLHDVLWAELSKWNRKMNSMFSNQFQWTKERFFHKDHPEEWFAAARTATKENPEAMQGFHTDYVMRLIDEASGIDESIFEYIEGATGIIETKEFMTGNPTRLDGTFFDSHNKMRKFYRPLHWSCLDSPIVPKRFIERLTRKFGTESNIYKVRVLGEFPLRHGDSFIPYDLVEAALIRDIPPQDDKPKVFGVDVARYGDDRSVIAIRQGDQFHPYHVLQGKNNVQVARYVANLANQQKPQMIFVDVIGLGAGVFDILEAQDYPVFAVNVSELPAQDGATYHRLRDELWGNMRDWLEARRGRLWDNEDGDLLGELTKPKYDHTHNGQIIIESKDKMRKAAKDDYEKRGTASPDIADAHIMTFAMPVAEYTKEDDFFANLRQQQQTDRYEPVDQEAGY